MSANQPGQDDGLYSYDSFSVSKKPSDSSFLWWCAGTHQKLLKKFPSEHSKYSGLGGVVLATFVLASLSSGYAVYSIFGNIWWTIVFGLIWGLIIFNLDRFLVSTMRKYGVSRRKQFWMTAPRLLLALLIGLTIARPLELKIFEKEIDVKVVENIHTKMQLNDSLLQLENVKSMAAAQAERDRLVARKTALEDTLHQLRQSYVQEADGTGGSMARGIENLTRLKMNVYNNARLQFEPELVSLAAGIKSQDSLLNSSRASLEEKRKEYEKSAQANVGFLERNKALSDLVDEESSVFWATLMISLLIILIEIGPILAKLIMPLGPYDIALAKEELMQMSASETEMRRDKELTNEKKKNFYRRQKEMSDELTDKMTALQKKNIDDELEKWERGDWNPKDHRSSMDEVMRKLRERYQLDDENLI
jgi:Ni/Co efflux regulator RcnB